MKDGWHKICVYDVYVENDRVLRGTKANGTLPSYVFRSCKHWNWVNASGITVNAFRSGVRRGTIRMF